ncbi:MAG: RHS repeat-associated core domain-containing protein [Phycisphaerae bacterium]
MVATNDKSTLGSAANRRTQPLVNHLHQGMTLDAATGLYYDRARDYSPSLGRWMEQDPAQYINGANTYQFVDSSPAGLVDPSGRWALWNPLSWPIWHDIFHSTPVRAAKHAVKYAVPGGEMCDAAGVLPGIAKALIAKDAINRLLFDDAHLINPSTDPLYNGLTNWSQGAPLTPAQHDAVQQWLNDNAR